MKLNWSKLPTFHANCLWKILINIHTKCYRMFVFAVVFKLKFNQESLFWDAKHICSISTKPFIFVFVQLKLIILFCILWCKCVMAFFIDIFRTTSMSCRFFESNIWTFVERYHQNEYDIIERAEMRHGFFVFMIVWQSLANSATPICLRLFFFHYISHLCRSCQKCNKILLPIDGFCLVIF